MLRPCPHLCRYFGKSFWVEIFRNSLDKKNGDVILQHHMCLTLPPFFEVRLFCDIVCNLLIDQYFYSGSIMSPPVAFVMLFKEHNILCVCFMCGQSYCSKQKKNPHICVDIAYFPKNQDTGASTANVSLLSNLSCFV